MLSYFPAIQPYQQHRILVGEPHELYVEECGNARGLPVLVVHGGPGQGLSEQHRRLFDPSIYRIILFDQRGCGRSQPFAELTANHLPALLDDMEVIRETLNIQRWMLAGGQWGSTLSLAYAQAHPSRVMGMVLWSVFLCRDADIDWLGAQGVGRIFPEWWQELEQGVAGIKAPSMLAGYQQRLTGSDELAAMAAAKAWSVWMQRCSALQPDRPEEAESCLPHTAMSLAKIGSHYLLNRGFLAENQLLHEVKRLANIPGLLVHGRYDMLTPLENAWSLHRAWPLSELRVIRQAGHDEREPAMVDGLMRAIKTMARYHA